MDIYHWMVSGAIVCLVAVSLMHSYYGERMLIGPLLKHKGNRLLEHPLGRMLLRFAWHITSIAWLVLAFILYTMAFTNARLDAAILSSIGASFLAMGVFDLIVSRGKHMGWPILTLIGVFALLARYNLATG